MAIPNTAGMQRKPTHPGEMLREGFIPDYGLTVAGLTETARSYLVERRPNSF